MHIMMIGPSGKSKGGISQVVSDYASSGLMNNLAISYFPTYSDGTKLKKVTFYLKGLSRILGNIHRFDIVHIHSSYGWSFRRLMVVFVIAKIFRQKILLHIHGSRFDEWYDGSLKLEKCLIQLGLNKADVVIALSEEWKIKLLKIALNARVEVLRNGINLDEFPKERTIPHPVPPYQVLFLGRLGKRKGVYDIIEASSLLSPGQFTFILAGDGQIRQVKDYISERQLQTIFHVPGWVTGKRKTAFLQNSDLFLLPSYHEGLPISILEAMASHLPVVATHVGGIPQVLKHNENGYIVPCGDHKALSKAIEKVFSEPEKWTRFSSQSRKIIEQQFGMARVEQDLSRLYQTFSDSAH